MIGNTYPQPFFPLGGTSIYVPVLIYVSLVVGKCDYMNLAADCRYARKSHVCDQ